MEHSEMVNRKSGATRRNKRRCVPVVSKLEDRGLLSAVGADVAAAAVARPTLVAAPQVAEGHSATAQLARRDALVAARHEAPAARFARVIRFPGGEVVINRTGTHVVFPGGSVRAGRNGAVVTFPGGYVISGFGHTIVRYPGGFIDI